MLNYLSSSDESETNGEDDQDGDDGNLESPVMKFPDKVRHKTDISVNKILNTTVSLIPKLDLTKLKSKYTALKNVEIAECKAKSNRSNNEYIEKLKFQSKVCKNSVKIMQKKIEKYKKIFDIQKQQIVKLKNKNELLEIQMKKSQASTNDDNSNVRKDVNNTSMVF